MPLTANLHLLSPEFALAGLAFAVFAADLLLPANRKEPAAWLSVAGLLGLIALSLIMLRGEDEVLYGGLLAIDAYSLFFKVFFLALGAFIIVASMEFVKQHLENQGEFYGLVLLSVLAMNMMAQSRELLTAYISLELLSFCLYVLAAYARSEPKSNEAGLKYIIIGAFSSAILLYGISMVYSTLGVTRFEDISMALAASGDPSPALWVGLALILVGLGFKVSAVPFHMWAPDVYEGAPLPVTAYLAIGSKAAAFVLLLRLFNEAFLPVAGQWQLIVAVMAAVTMLVGNLVALAQRNIKRLMAYSSIGHVGIISAGIAALSPDSIQASNGIMLYLVGYSATNLLVFAGLISFFNMTGREQISDFAGLADRSPFLAAAIAIGLFSLGGLPIFAGFTVKFYLFAALAREGLLWLAGLAIFSSLISLYYYLQVIRQMYIEPAVAWPENPGEVTQATPEVSGAVVSDTSQQELALSPSVLMLAVLSVGVLGVIGVGVYPDPLLELIEGGEPGHLASQLEPRWYNWFSHLSAALSCCSLFGARV